ncbi:MAG: sigma-70 family RNA polymerase sigma factor [Blastocatellia bacterium]|nr:sigma-70 family RNA polymerase sigma factor [Blastocatellia bacterium]
MSTPMPSSYYCNLIVTLLPDIRRFVLQSFMRYKRYPQDADVEDMSQQIVVLLIEDDYRRLRTFDDQRSSLKTWLWVVVIREVVRHLRSQRVMISLEELLSDSVICEADQDKRVLSGERSQRLRATIPKLSEREQQLFRLCLCEELCASDIAKQMGMTVGSVPVRKNAVIKKLKMLLEINPLQSGVVR